MEHEADEKRARTFGLIIEELGIFLEKAREKPQML